MMTKGWERSLGDKMRPRSTCDEGMCRRSGRCSACIVEKELLQKGWELQCLRCGGGARGEAWRLAAPAMSENLTAADAKCLCNPKAAQVAVHKQYHLTLCLPLLPLVLTLAAYTTGTPTSRGSPAAAPRPVRGRAARCPLPRPPAGATGRCRTRRWKLSRTCAS